MSVRFLYPYWLILGTALFLNGCQTLPSWPRGITIAEKELETRRFTLEKQQTVIGNLTRFVLQPGDTLADVARHFGIGFQAMKDANPGIDPWLPRPGQTVVLPLSFILPDAPRSGIVLNLAAMRLFYHPRPDGGRVFSFPIGIGRAGWDTPRGRTRIIQKKVMPSWFVPASIRREHAMKGDPLPPVVKPGPDNPLGQYALRLNIPGYLIHGTNKPYGVGQRISHGCVRLYPEDIEVLFPKVRRGTPVTIVDQPYLLGWRRGRLYLQIYPPLTQNQHKLSKLWQSLKKRLQQAEREAGKKVDWHKVDLAVTEALGLPVPVLKDSPAFSSYLARLPKVAHPEAFYGAYRTPPLKPGWYLALGDNFNRPEIQRLVAILHHQGPPYPAHALKNQDGAYRLVIGPYEKRRKASRERRRLNRELELKAKILQLDQNTWLTGPAF